MNPTRHFATRLQTLTVVLVAVVGISITIFGSPASAHEGRQVGDYNFVVGFLREPAYEGQLNAVSLIVTRIADEGHPTDDTSATDADTESHAPADDHHDHSHSHGDEETRPSSATIGDEMDVLTHGAVFISPGLKRDEAFDFEISEELKGLGIPYHIHPGDRPRRHHRF